MIHGKLRLCWISEAGVVSVENFSDKVKSVFMKTRKYTETLENLQRLN